MFDYLMTLPSRECCGEIFLVSSAETFACLKGIPYSYFISWGDFLEFNFPVWIDGWMDGQIDRFIHMNKLTSPLKAIINIHSLKSKIRLDFSIFSSYTILSLLCK